MKKRILYLSSFILIVLGVGIFIDQALFKPTEINSFIATKIYSSPANKAFTDDNFYKCVVDAYNKKNNTSLPYTTNLSDEQLKTITELSCRACCNKPDNEKIKSIDGLEKLTALTYLNVEDNQLTSLDVSKNTALEGLQANSNKLISLDVSRATALTYLHVSNNELTSLDVSKNKVLVNLDVGANQLTSINVSKNTELAYLFVFKNQLTELDVSKNTKLITLAAFRNLLNELDVSDNVLLETLLAESNELTYINLINNINLKYLCLTNNKLSSLDISNNTKLTFLDVGYWVHFSMNSLGPSSNSRNLIEELNVKNNVLLENLYVNNNELTSLDVSKNTMLTTLYARNNQITSLDVSKNTALTDLSVGGNQLTSLDVSNNTSLTRLDVYDNQLTSLDVSKNAALKELQANSNKLISLDVSGATALKELNVNDNKLTSLDVSKNTALKELQANSNKLISLDVSRATALTYLHVNNNELTSLDVGNNELTSLDVSNNKLTELDVSGATALRYLNVGNNELTSLDVSNNTSLTRLDVYDNQLTKLDVSKNTALTSLYVGGNKLTKLDVSKNTALTDLGVGSNQLTSLDVGKNSLLTYLYVYGNPFATNIIIYKGSINTDGDNRFVKLPEGKTSTLTRLKSNNSVVNIDGNNININKIGEYVVTVDYKHDIQSIFNTYSGTYNIKVIEITSDKYMINEENSYIYTSTDIDNDTILSNINLDSECTKVIENNELVIKYNDEVLKKFKIINISSTKYDLSKEYIYDNSFNKDNINVINGTSEVVDNELLIKYNDEVLDKYKIISISSSKYDLNKEYIYVGTGDIDLDSIKVINGSYEVVNNELILKYGEEVLDRYKIVSISSSKYDLSKEYIYDNSFNKDNINVINGTSEVVDNELLIKYNDKVLDRYKIVSISSTKYDLSKEYIYDNSFNKDNINVTNGTSEVVDNELLIKYNDDVLERYKIVSISSTKYDLSKEYIYIGTGDIDLDSIKVVNGTIELVDNELILKYGEEVLDRYKIIGIKFGDLKVNINLVVITKNITYDVFISNITTNGVTYKIFNGEEEITSGNISKGMVVKVYYNDEEVYTYNITDEYLEFMEPLEVVDETKRIYNVKLNTSVNDLLSKINTSGTIIVRNNKNEVISGNALVGTGTKVIIKLSSGTKEYTLVIKGDVTGTGTSSVSDVAKLYQYLKKKINMEDYFIEAGNVVNTDNEIRINDVAKLYQFIKGKLNSLE